MVLGMVKEILGTYKIQYHPEEDNLDKVLIITQTTLHPASITKPQYTSLNVTHLLMTSNDCMLHVLYACHVVVYVHVYMYRCLRWILLLRFGVSR